MTLWRNVGKALSGTVVAQLIPVLGAIILARQYDPAQFGAFAAWLGITLMLAVVLTGRFETVLAIEPDGAPRREAATHVLLTVLLACLPCAAIVLLIASATDVLSAGLWVPLVPAAAAIAAAQTWQSWAAADGRYGVLGVMRVGQAVSITTLQVATGFLFPSAEALAWSHFGGALLAVLYSLRLMPPAPWRARGTLRAFWIKHRRFPQYSLPADSINAAAAQLPILIVATRFGADAAGLLALTLRTLGAPIGLLGKSVLDVFKRYAADAYRSRGECRAEYLATLRVLATGSLGASVALALSSEWLFAVAFGEEWRRAGLFAVWLLPMFALRFVASPLSYMVYIAGKQQVDLLWQLALLAMTLLTLYGGQSVETALHAYSLGYTLLYVVYLVMSYRFSLGAKGLI